MNEKHLEEIKNSDWFKTRPKSIQNLILQYHPDTEFDIDGKHYYIIGYSEGENNEAVGLKLTEIDPVFLYKEAIEHSIYVCLDCIKGLKLCSHE